MRQGRYKPPAAASLLHNQSSCTQHPLPHPTACCSLCARNPPPHLHPANTMALAMRTATSRPTATVNRASRTACVPRAALAKVAKRAPAAPQQRKTPPAGFELGFTSDNELTLSRLSMLGFAGTVVGEYLSGGSGPLAQLGYNLGLEASQVGIFLAGLIAFNLAASVLPSASRAQQQQPAGDEAAAGPLQDPRITLLQPAKFFNVTEWGFTAQNELFAGRVSLLGWVAALIGEVATGLGPVGQLSAETGVPANTIFFALAAWAAFMATRAVDKLAVKPIKTTSSKTGSSKQDVAASGGSA